MRIEDRVAKRSGLSFSLLLVCACGSSETTSDAGTNDAGPADSPSEVDPGPTTLIDASYPHGIAVDDNYVYYTSSVDGTLSRMPKNGGVPEVLATGMTNPHRVALDDASAYVAVIGTADAYDDGELVRVAKDGSSSQTLASGLHGAGGIFIDGDEAYIACGGESLNGAYVGDGQIERVKTDGSSAIEVLLQNEQYPALITVDQTSLYFTARYSGLVVRCDKANCTSTRTALFSSLDEPIGLAQSGNMLVFTEYHGGRVLTGGTDGSNMTTLEGSRGLPLDVLTDGTHIYWEEDLTREIERQTFDPKIRFTTLGQTAQGPTCMAMDAIYIYVTDEHAGTITRFAR